MFRLSTTIAAAALAFAAPAQARDQWTKAEAARWYAAQAWLVGSNYAPASAINRSASCIM